ncbi:MAG: lipopolysaccharide assembly protein LapA domain-containing protein [candidate division Zixibacteria bacterium]|nr:lipopolysaccharide assembly protein LapA domain-containing protein [candidate division Zixibacteria bacterium]
MWIFRSILILVIIAVIVGFAVYNSGPGKIVDVDLIWAKRFDVPVITLVFWSFVLGSLISLLLFISVYLKQSNQLREANRAIKGLQTEVTSLRNRPIEESKNLLDKKGSFQE